jgi:hypothetical protein
MSIALPESPVSWPTDEESCEINWFRACELGMKKRFDF